MGFFDDVDVQKGKNDMFDFDGDGKLNPFEEMEELKYVEEQLKDHEPPSGSNTTGNITGNIKRNISSVLSSRSGKIIFIIWIVMLIIFGIFGK